MSKKIIHYCPECARELYQIDSRIESSVIVRCECGRYYRVDRKQVLRVNKPERNTASGVMFH